MKYSPISLSILATPEGVTVSVPEFDLIVEGCTPDDAFGEFRESLSMLLFERSKQRPLTNEEKAIVLGWFCEPGMKIEDWADDCRWAEFQQIRERIALKRFPDVARNPLANLMIPFIPWDSNTDKWQAFSINAWNALDKKGIEALEWVEFCRCVSIDDGRMSDWCGSGILPANWKDLIRGKDSELKRLYAAVGL